MDTDSVTNNVSLTEFVGHTAVPALITANLLNPASSTFADLINSNLQTGGSRLRVVYDEKAVACNPDLQASVDAYFAAHPWLNYFSCEVCSLDELNTLTQSATALTDQFYLFFGGQRFLATIHDSPVASIAIATQATGETMIDFDSLAHSLHLKSGKLSCMCFDSKLIISDLQYNRSSWVVRGIQYALFNDSQMYHWIEGNLHQLFGNDRTAIDQLFCMIFTQLLTSEEVAQTSSPMNGLVNEFKQDKSTLLNIGLLGYAQTMSAMMLLSTRYATEAGTIEEGIDGRVLHLLQQIVWIAPSHARMIENTPTLSTMPVLTALGSHKMQTVDGSVMGAARIWLAAQLLKYKRVA